MAQEHPQRARGLSGNDVQQTSKPQGSRERLPPHRRVTSQRVLDLHPLPGHRPIKFTLHLEEALIHLGVLCELGHLRERMRDGLVGQFSFSVGREVSDLSETEWG